MAEPLQFQLMALLRWIALACVPLAIYGQADVWMAFLLTIAFGLLVLFTLVVRVAYAKNDRPATAWEWTYQIVAFVVAVTAAWVWGGILGVFVSLPLLEGYDIEGYYKGFSIGSALALVWVAASRFTFRLASSPTR